MKTGWPFARKVWLGVTEAELRDEENPRARMQDALLVSRELKTREDLTAALGPPVDDERRAGIVGEREKWIPKATASALSWATYRGPDGDTDLIIFYLDAHDRVLRAQMEAR